MNKEIENIIKKNLPEKKEHRVFECNGAYNGRGCYEDWCDVETCNSKDAIDCKGFNQALSQINTSLIADEVLKVMVETCEKIDMSKTGTFRDKHLEESYQMGARHFKELLNLHLSPNKENKNNG